MIERFWQIRNDHDYCKLILLLAGKKMHFEVLEIAGDEHAGRSCWLWKRPDGDFEGVGLYKVGDGQLSSCRDFYAVPVDG